MNSVLFNVPNKPYVVKWSKNQWF